MRSSESQSKQSRGLAIVGAFGGVNIGDEMILRSVLSNLTNLGYSRAPVVVCGPTPGAEAWERDYQRYGVKLYSWRNPLAAGRAVWGRDLFIGGGQLIDGSAGIQNPLVQLGLASAAKMGGGRVVVGGVGALDIPTRSIRTAYRGLFAVADSVNLRDDDSLETVRRFGVKANHLARTADTVFALRSEILPDQQSESPRRVIGFAIHHAPHRPLTEIDKAADALEAVLTCLPEGYSISLLAHDLREDFDLGFARTLMGRIDDPRIQLQTFRTTQDCIDTYREMQAIISVRMHPIIIGACAGCAIVPLRGSPKQAALTDRLGLRDFDMTEIALLSPGDLATLLGLNGRGQRPAEAVLAELEREAMRNFISLAQRGVT